MTDMFVSKTDQFMMAVKGVTIEAVIKVIKEECFDDCLHLVNVDCAVDHVRRCFLFRINIHATSSLTDAVYECFSNRLLNVLDRIKETYVDFSSDSIKFEVNIHRDERKQEPVSGVATKVKDKIKEETKVKPFIVIPEVEEIIHRKSNRGEFFTVVWTDKTKTTVKLMEGEESDDYSAFMYCVGKKMFKDKGEARKFITEKKEVFENRMAEISEKRAEFKAMKNFENAVLSDPDFSEELVPVMVSRDIFRRNRG